VEANKDKFRGSHMKELDDDGKWTMNNEAGYGVLNRSGAWNDVTDYLFLAPSSQ
jgi:hypothetical protein